MTAPEAVFIGSLWGDPDEIDVVDVVVDVDAPDLRPFYTYSAPESMSAGLLPGACVHIGFNRQETLGYILRCRRLSRSDPLCAHLKPVIAVVEGAVTINSEQLKLVQWMSDKYLCSLIDAVRCVAPAILSSQVRTYARLTNPAIRPADLRRSVPQAHIVEQLCAQQGEVELEQLKRSANLPGFASAYSALISKGVLSESRRLVRPKVIEQRIKAYRLGVAAADETAQARRPSPQQRRIVNVLEEWERVEPGPMPASELLRAADVRATSVKGLVEKGVLVAVELSTRRAPFKTEGVRTTAPLLSPAQERAADALRIHIRSGDHRTALLFGVTASGKTEVYLNAIEATLQLGRTAIVLLPEIALTAQVLDVFAARFGDLVAVLHSRLSEGERHDEWRRIQNGDARIVVGARSAVFAPVENVGLIVVDEEHESSYKQDKSPRYDARDLAAYRAELSSATLVLGSATPSLESYYAATLVAPASGEPAASALPSPIDLVTMPERIENRALPQVTVVDLREEFKVRRALFSERLAEAMEKRLQRREQVILFLNRRGYAQFVLCRDCGWAAKCPHCAVSLAYHVYDRALKCHHCEYKVRPPLACPDCGGEKVRAFGLGTEKVEEEVHRLFPHARSARMDRDTTSRKGAHGKILRDFRQGDADILIGTQMVAKGLDFPNVTLVGVVSADTAINMPDFRAAERTFQLLTQVAGRAGRGATPGEVIIQTFSPDHYAVQSAIRHDYLGFYDQEIQFRAELKYPPFSRFANLICSAAAESVAVRRASALAAALQRTVPESIEIIGPSPAPIARLKGEFRYHVALRAPIDAPLSEIVRSALSLLTAADRIAVIVDIDPLNMS